MLYPQERMLQGVDLVIAVYKQEILCFFVLRIINYMLKLQKEHIFSFLH